MPTPETRLQYAARAGPFLAPQDERALIAAARKAGLTLLRLDLKGVRDKQGLLTAIAKALEFPEWFGGNWDALEECLTDMPGTETHGFVLLFDHCADFVKHAPHEFATAKEVFESVAKFWAGRGKAFWTLFGGIGKLDSGLRPLA